jgi:hypothetical protein
MHVGGILTGARVLRQDVPMCLTVCVCVGGEGGLQLDVYGCRRPCRHGCVHVDMRVYRGMCVSVYWICMSVRMCVGCLSVCESVCVCVCSPRAPAHVRLHPEVFLLNSLSLAVSHLHSVNAKSFLCLRPPSWLARSLTQTFPCRPMSQTPPGCSFSCTYSWRGAQVSFQPPSMQTSYPKSSGPSTNSPRSPRKL